MSLRILGRGLLVLLLDAVALLLLSEVLPGFVLDGAPAALGAAAAIGVLNALVWPLLARVALPLTVLTLGLGALLLNAILVTVAINLIPGAEVDGVLGGDRDHDRDQRPDRDLLLAAGDRRGRHLVPERRRPSGAASQRLGRHRCARDRLPRDRRPRPRCPSPGDRRRQRPPPGRLAAGRIAPARALGNRLVIPDRRLPGRAPARQQRRHARLPLVGEGPRHRDRHQSPPRRRGARAPPLRREGTAPRRRRQPRQHPLRRRAALDADDEHRADPPTADRARLLRLLRPALRGRPHLRPGAGRHRARAPRRPQPGARRRPAADRRGRVPTPWSGPGGRSSSATSRSQPWSATSSPAGR